MSDDTPISATQALSGDDQLRWTVAQHAARLIHDGLNDYQAAKKKAARRLGLTHSAALPDNHMLDAALREYQALFAPDQHAELLKHMRASALRAMRWLHRFSPWISGAVLTGSATETSAIEIELLEIDQKQLEFFLIEEGIEFDCDALSVHGAHGHSSRRRDSRAAHDSRGAPLKYAMEFEDIPLNITVFSGHAARGARFPKTSLRHDRAQIEEARRRFEENDHPPRIPGESSSPSC